jgi:3-deoxy-7-phosphoheptulonate synthase
MNWAPGSWRTFEARQQPDYPDPASLEAAERALSCRPGLVRPTDVDALIAALADAQVGRAILIQGGDCAESFAASPTPTVRLLRAMADIVADSTGQPVVAVGRLAGQYAKPRSEPLEHRDGVTLPVWRGDSVNGCAFEAETRRADPARLLRAYESAFSTLDGLAGQPLWASHEALLLSYEEALVRTHGDRAYASSGHLLWIGARTLFPGSAHVEFARGIANPLGLKCGPSLDSDTLVRLLDTLNPHRLAGRITLICRMGRDHVGRALPPLVRAVRRSGHPLLWACDPMHGNTRRGRGGRKVRLLPDIFAETLSFIDIATAEGIFAGGLHIEMTGDDVAECDEAGVATACDPRLNPAQALDLARVFAGAARPEQAPPRRALA